jgi:Cof subfamily protein (haloacid dehalogenase superfamily)
MKKYLIALDLDGTLLKDWESMSDETIEYLKEIQKQGHEIVIATGRPFRSSEAFHKQLGLTTPIINYNGGLVSSKHDDTFEGYSITVDFDSIHDIFETSKDIIENAFGEIEDDIFLWKDTEEIQPLLHNFNGARLFVGEFKDILARPTNGFIIIAKQGKGDKIQEYIRANYTDKLLCRNWGEKYNFIIELYTPETNKANALDHVRRHLGFEQDQIIAFGDGDNDVEMIQYAGRGVAMQNARNVLKEVADEITEYSNKEDGIMKHLKKILK